MDSEADPIQELTVFEVNSQSLAIIDIYHGYANSETCDTYAHSFIHGLNPNYLSSVAFPNECDLINDVKCWLNKKSFNEIFANDPKKEHETFPLYNFVDIGLPPWLTRYTESYHVMANKFKSLNIPICNTFCPFEAHSCYRSPPWAPRNATAVVKVNHGYHCSLYDTYELYLFYIMSFQ